MTTDLVSVVRDRGDWPPGIEPGLRRAAQHVLVTVDTAAAAAGLETTIVLTDDDSVQDLNSRYRGQAKPTNVLSFPIQDPHADRATLDQSDCLGEIYLAAGTVTREAAAEDKSLEAHLTHLVVHGMLHLLGFDHMSEFQAEEMEGWERRLLADLGIADPYAAPPDASTDNPGEDPGNSSAAAEGEADPRPEGRSLDPPTADHEPQRPRR